MAGGKFFASLRSGKGSLSGLVNLAGNNVVEVTEEVARTLEAVYADTVKVAFTLLHEGEATAEGAVNTTEAGAVAATKAAESLVNSGTADAQTVATEAGDEAAKAAVAAAKAASKGK